MKVNYAPTDPAAYPISTTTWVLVAKQQNDPAKGKLLKAFLLYALGAGQESADSLYYAPLPGSLTDQAKAAAESIVA